MQPLFEVLSEDHEFVVVYKPSGLVCHPTKGDEYSSLIGRARLYLGAAGTPHLINRLDRETSGIVIVARHAEAAAGLRKLWEARQVDKEYLAIVHGHPAKSAFQIDAPLGKDHASPIAIKDAVVPGGAASRTRIYVLRRFYRAGQPFSLVRVHPVTGRKHQIRIHLSHAGYPIVGDKLYGADENLYLAFVRSELTAAQKSQLITDHHALHAGRLSFSWRGALRTIACPPEQWFLDFAGQ